MNTECLSISQRMLDASPVFIVGIPRSGTTALRRTLAGHPRFLGRSPRGPETRIFIDPARLYKIHKPSGDRLLRYFLEDNYRADQMLQALGPKPPRRSDTARAFDLEPSVSASFTASGRADLVRVFFHFANLARGAERILEKTPEHLHHLAEIRETFPRAHVLLCIRHPVDVLSSFRKRKEKEEREGRSDDGSSWMSVSVEGFIERFADEASRILNEHADRQDQSTLVRYEDLTTDPAATLRRICEDIGEEYDEAALLDREVRTDDSGAPKPDGRITLNERSFEPYLTREDARQIEDALRHVLTPLGYTPRAFHHEAESA